MRLANGTMSRDQRLTQLLQPVIEDLGYEFVGVKYLAQPGAALLRLYIDRPEQGITVDDCARVSREVGAQLDVEDPIPGHYRLEVSSPGLDRPLFTPAQFERFKGSQARITLSAPVAERRKFKGQIRAVDDGQIVLDVDGQEVRVAHDNVVKANLVPEFC